MSLGRRGDFWRRKYLNINDAESSKTEIECRRRSRNRAAEIVAIKLIVKLDEMIIAGDEVGGEIRRTMSRPRAGCQL